MTPIKLAAAVAAALCAVAISACGDDDETTAGTTTATASGIEVSDAWARTTAPTQTSGAVYMTISAPDGDALTKASVPSAIAGKTELHETTSDGAAHGDDMKMDDEAKKDMDGMKDMKRMKEVASIDIAAGKTMTLKPGGYHVMLLELAEPITDGQKIPVTLTFKDAGTVEVEATARPT